MMNRPTFRQSMRSPARVCAIVTSLFVAISAPSRAFADLSSEQPAPPATALPDSPPSSAAPVSTTPPSAEALLPPITIDASPSEAAANEPAPTSPPAQRPHRFLLRANTGAIFGTTGYGLRVTISGFGARSQLDYSLDTITAGLDLAYLGGGGTSRPWSLHASFDTNLGDPFGTLLDRDWVTYRGVETEFSHTDSRLTARIILLDVSTRIALAGSFRPGSVVFDLVIGYRHESMVFDGWGLIGWQMPTPGTRYSTYLDRRIRGIHYESQKPMPHIGFGLHGSLARWMRLDADASLGLAFSIDDDDHLLRFKRLNATSTGVGLLLHVAPQWIVYGSAGERSSVALGVDVQVRALWAWGRLHQFYYEDDPRIPGDQRLVVIPDSDFLVTSVIGTVRATLDVRF